MVHSFFNLCLCLWVLLLDARRFHLFSRADSYSVFFLSVVLLFDFALNRSSDKDKLSQVCDKVLTATLNICTGLVIKKEKKVYIYI